MKDIRKIGMLLAVFLLVGSVFAGSVMAQPGKDNGKGNGKGSGDIEPKAIPWPGTITTYVKTGGYLLDKTEHDIWGGESGTDGYQFLDSTALVYTVGGSTVCHVKAGDSCDVEPLGGPYEDSCEFFDAKSGGGFEAGIEGIVSATSDGFYDYITVDWFGTCINNEF